MAIYLYHRQQQAAAAAAAQKQTAAKAKAKAQADAAAAAQARAQQQQAAQARAQQQQQVAVELKSLEAKVQAQVVAPETQGVEPEYTGGTAPTTGRMVKEAPTTEEKIASLVEEHQTKRTPPKKVIAAPAPPPLPAAPVEKKPFNLITWAKDLLFGGADDQGLGQTNKKNKLKIIVPALLVIALLIYLKR